jgi:23S rRNA (uracil1939-C5)-methyltransferase
VAEEVLVSRLGPRGDGIAEAPPGPLYVPFTLPGERILVEREGADRGRLVEVLAPSAERVAPYCPHAGTCGGCAVQHWRPDAALAWKRRLLVDALARVGIEAEVAPTVDAHGAGRRRATLHARRQPDGRFRVGFNVARTHDLVDLAADPCPLLVPGLKGAVPAVAAAAATLARLGKPLDAVATATDAGLDLDLRGPGRLPEPERLALVDLAAAHDLARLSLHGEVLVERRPPTLRFGMVAIVPPPGGFLQAVAAAETTMAKLVSDHFGKARRVADLFAGSGAFALRLAAKAEVHAVEGDAAALAALDRGYRFASGLKRVTTEVRDLFRRPLTGKDLAAFDAVVFDPPRAGAEDQAKQIARSAVPLVAAVSCNPVTLARDLRILLDGGYALRAVIPVDQFLWSPHVEAVALLEKPKRRR